jgi:hypothetical protein
MDVKALNKIKGDEVIKKLHSLLTKSTEKTCIKMTIEYQQCIHTQLRLTTLVLLWGRILDKSKRNKSDPTMSPSCFKFVDYVYKGYHIYSYVCLIHVHWTYHINWQWGSSIRTKHYNKRDDFNLQIMYQHSKNNGMWSIYPPSPVIISG